LSIYPITTSLKIVKELQHVKEIVKGSTPTNPIFTAIPTLEFTPTITGTNINFIKLGKADITQSITDTTDYDLSITYAPISSTLLESMVNLTGTDNRENSFTFLLSQQHNSGAGTLTEQYQIARGCNISSVTISVTSGEFVTVNSEWFAASISDWNASHGLSGTPVFGSALTTVPWSALTTGPSPLTFNGLSYDIDNFSCTINHNTERVHPLTTNNATRIDPRIRDITIEVDIVYKNNVISQDVKTLTPRSMIMSLHNESGDITTVEFEDVYLESYDETVNAESTDAKVISYTGYATEALIRFAASGIRHISKALTENILISHPAPIALPKPKRSIKALGTETILISESLGIVTSVQHLQRIISQSVSISENLIPSITYDPARTNYVTSNFTSANFVGGEFVATGLQRALPTELVSVSESVAIIVTYGTTSQNFVPQNFAIDNFPGGEAITVTADFTTVDFVNTDFLGGEALGGGPNNVVRAVPTQTVTISETSLVIRRNKIRTRSDTAITISETKARLAAKSRAVPTQTVTISENVARVKGTAGVNITRAVPTQTVSISENVARVKAKNVSKALPTETVTVAGGTLGRLAAKIRQATSS
jgi:hypothetical protein